MLDCIRKKLGFTLPKQLPTAGLIPPVTLQTFPGLQKSKNLARYLSKRDSNLNLLPEKELRKRRLSGTNGKCYRGDDGLSIAPKDELHTRHLEASVFSNKEVTY